LNLVPGIMFVSETAEVGLLSALFELKLVVLMSFFDEDVLLRSKPLAFEEIVFVVWGILLFFSI